MSATASATSKKSYSDITESQGLGISALYEGNRLLIAKPGYGKTIVGATAIDELLTERVVNRVLIVAPLRVCREAWLPVWDEWDHLPSGERSIAVGDGHRRRTAIEEGAPVVVINFENLVWFFNTYGHDHGFDGLLIDEISKLKSAGSKLVKKLRHHTKDFTWRCGLSGTPVAEAPADIFSQALVIDEGAALGRRKDRFLQTYFWQTDYQGYEWELRPGALEQLTEKLQEVIYMADDTAYQAALPSLNIHQYLMNMPETAWDCYNALCSDGVVEKDDQVVEVPNAAVLQGKLQQLCCGATYSTTSLLWWHERKYTAVRELLEEDESSTVVVYWFQYEKAKLRADYPEMVFLADSPDAVDRWNAGEIKHLAVHPKSCGHGLNLQFGGHRMIWLSPVWSADLWHQTIARVWRQGQARDVNVWVLVVVGSVEEMILERLEQKRLDEDEFTEAFRAHVAAHSSTMRDANYE